MWKSLVLLLCVSGYSWAGPVGSKRNMPIVLREDEPKIMEVYASNEMAEAERPSATTTTTQEAMYMSTLTLPSNATSIRADITDGFSCENKTYGYYADVDNDCQIFHVCLPVTYADGKENTFRWSFICPEETIFSQDSFTCMRPEDMTIDCEESAQYYELNRNFGQVDDESNKNNQGNSMVTKPALNEPVESEIPQAKPVALQEEEEMEMEKATAAPMVVEPVKPVKVSKPHRRKPGQSSSSYGVQHKLTATYPLRKMPQVSAIPAVAVAAPVVEVEEAKPEEPVRPVTKFTKRPVMAMNIREKIQQTANAEPTVIRTELYNQNRKRPAYLNRKESVVAVTSKPAAAVEEMPLAAVEEAAEVVVAPVAVLKAEAPLQVALEEHIDANPQMTAESEADIDIDADTQASETAEIFVKPQEVEEEKEKAETAPINVMAEQAAVETSPIVIESVEKLPTTETEAEPTKEQAIVQEPVAVVSEELKPLEAFEEIPAVIVETEEAAAAKPIEMSPPAEMSETQDNTVEAAVPTLEEMEDLKPADAVETMPATPEMEHVNPMVQEMFESADNHQSMGGFKPVDPAMAAEAEALITDFINSLRKAEHTQAEAGVGAEAGDDTPAEILGEPELFRLDNTEGEAEAESESVAETVAQVEDAKLPEPQVEEEEKEVDAKQQEEQTANVETEMAVNQIEEEQKADASPVAEELSQEKMESSEASVMNEESHIAAQPEVSETQEEEEAHLETADQPAVAMPVAIETESVVDEKPLENNALKTISESQTDEEEKPIAAEIPAAQNESEVPIASAIATKTVQEDTQAPQIIEPSANTMMMMNHFPNEMFQIPVQIIETPMEEMQQALKTEEQSSEEKTVESQANPEEIMPETAPVEPQEEEEIVQAPVTMQQESLKYTPLSIDDIVELVKERLDQMPSAEKGMPMQMVMESSETANGESTQEAEKQEEKEEEVKEEEVKEEEEIVMPIYHRAPEAEPNSAMNLLKSQEPQISEEDNSESMEPQTINEVSEAMAPMEETHTGDQLKPEETEIALASDAASQMTMEAAMSAKASRAYRARSIKNAKMDARKRRFLFRSDAN